MDISKHSDERARFFQLLVCHQKTTNALFDGLGLLLKYNGLEDEAAAIERTSLQAQRLISSVLFRDMHQYNEGVGV